MTAGQRSCSHVTVPMTVTITVDQVTYKTARAASVPLGLTASGTPARGIGPSALSAADHSGPGPQCR